MNNEKKNQKAEYWPRELKSTVKYFPMYVSPDEVLTELSSEFDYQKAFFMLTQLKIQLAKADYHLIRLDDITKKYCRRHFKCSVEDFNKMVELLLDFDFLNEWMYDEAKCLFSVEFSLELFESYRRNQFRSKATSFPKAYFPDLLVFTALENKIIAAIRSESPFRLDYTRLYEIRLDYQYPPKGGITGNTNHNNKSSSSDAPTLTGGTDLKPSDIQDRKKAAVKWCSENYQWWEKKYEQLVMGDTFYPDMIDSLAKPNDYNIQEWLEKEIVEKSGIVKKN